MMIMLLVMLSAIAAEALAELLSSALIFKGLRTFLGRLAVNYYEDRGWWFAPIAFMHAAITCGYCCSVWTAGFVSLFCYREFDVGFDSYFVRWLILTLVVHRIANWFHVLYTLQQRGRVSAIDVKMSVDQSTMANIDELRHSAALREGRKGKPIEQPNPTSFSDVLMILKSFDHVDDASAFDVDGVTITPAPSLTKRSMLLELLNQKETVKGTVIVNNKPMVRPDPVISSGTVIATRLAKMWSGGVLEGRKIKWQLNDGSCEYDLDKHELVKT